MNINNNNNKININGNISIIKTYNVPTNFPNKVNENSMYGKPKAGAGIYNNSELTQ